MSKFKLYIFFLTCLTANSKEAFGGVGDSPMFGRSIIGNKFMWYPTSKNAEIREVSVGDGSQIN